MRVLMSVCNMPKGSSNCYVASSLCIVSEIFCTAPRGGLADLELLKY